MGSGASALTTEQSTKLTQVLKEKYEHHKANGESDADIHNKLTAEYHNIIKSVADSTGDPASAEPSKLAKVGKSSTSSSMGKLPGRASFEDKSAPAAATPKPNTSSKLGLGSSKMNGAGGSTKGGGARRRSFDGNKTPGATAAAAAAAAAAVTQAATTAEAAAGPSSPVHILAPTAEDAQTDSWDSVTQQPFCAVCQMAFKSITFLERHVKYSDLHIRTVQKQKDSENAQASNPGIGSVDEMFPVTQSGKMEAKQIEGKHYRLIYSGSKLFWRTQDNIDLNIFHHILPSTIEIVSYDTVKAKEMNRIYCDYTALCDLSGVTAAASASAGARAAAARAAAARDLEATSAAGTAAKAEKVAATAAANAAAAAAADPSNVEDETAILARYIIQRLQLGPPIVGGSLKRMEFAKLSSDTNAKSPVMDKIPVVLIPIAVARRRRTNAEEIEQTMSSLALDRAALAEATAHAHKVASVMYSASTSIAAKKWWADFNPWRKKWIWAIRRVIRQKLVAETTAVLMKLEQEKKRELKRQFTGGGVGVSPKGGASAGKAKEV